jgi:hypothetical protein
MRSCSSVDFNAQVSGDLVSKGKKHFYTQQVFNFNVGASGFVIFV